VGGKKEKKDSALPFQKLRKITIYLCNLTKCKRC